MSSTNWTHNFFAHLERHSVELSPPADLGFWRDRWMLGLVALGALPALLPLARLTGYPVLGWLQVIGLVLQAIGLSAVSWRQARDVLPDFVDAKNKFAADMDSHFLRREGVLSWLRSLPPRELSARAAYVEMRLEALQSRYVLLFGAVDKLGVLPAVVALLVQVQGLGSVSPWLMGAGAGIAVFYAMGLWVSRFRLQMEGYTRLMHAATARVGGDMESAGANEHCSKEN